LEARNRQICKEIDGPVSVEVIATEASAMLTEARDLVKIARTSS
jgi:transaldolase